MCHTLQGRDEVPGSTGGAASSATAARCEFDYALVCLGSLVREKGSNIITCAARHSYLFIKRHERIYLCFEGSETEIYDL